MKHAFANRARYLADPGYADVPTAALIDPATIDDLARQIDLRRTFPPETYGSTIAGFESNGTSHFSIIDGEGRAVACTETINLPFGSLVGVPQWGIVLNDEMDDFTTTPGKANAFGLAQSDDNLPAPGKRPLSSMSPTIVTDRNGDVRAIAGASGGPRIITGTIQVLLNVLLLHQRPADAVSAPRFHHQWIPDRLDVEETWSNDALLAQLKARGHVIGRRPSVGKVQLIVVDEQGRRHAVSDPRKGGIPAGH
jgi:gamma-glutamyltranspeptidase/glutathione hydrolase